MGNPKDISKEIVQEESTKIESIPVTFSFIRTSKDCLANIGKRERERERERATLIMETI